jgi:hypothetical protein
VTRALYNYTTKGGVISSSIAAMLPGPVGVNIKALAYTQSACGIPDHPLDKFQGKNDRSCSGLRPSEDKCLEAAMDSQIISTTAIGCHTEFWNGGEGSFISMFKAINDAGDAAPRVFSFSFGDPETERDDDVQNTNKEFAKSVAKGITLVCSSGDNGAGHTLLGKYVTNFPASSPYVLSVGATSLITRASLTEASLLKMKATLREATPLHSLLHLGSRSSRRRTSRVVPSSRGRGSLRRAAECLTFLPWAAATMAGKSGFRVVSKRRQAPVHLPLSSPR